MKTDAATKSWAEANQAHLVAEFARLKHRLQLPGAEPSDPPAPALSALEPPPAIDRVTATFGLSAFERELLLLCAGIEMDAELALRCGAAQGLSQRAPATFGFALSFLPEPHWSALTPARPLRRFRLIELEAPGRGLTSSALRIDERVLHYLAGLNLLDQRLEPLLRPGTPPDWIAQDHRAAAEQIARELENQAAIVPVIHLCGDDTAGQEDTATFAAELLGLQLYTVRADDLAPVGPELEQWHVLWQREALLLPAALFIQGAGTGVTPAVRYLLERFPGLVFLGGREPVRLERALRRFSVNLPPRAEQKRLWEKALAMSAGTLNGSLDAVSEHYRLSAGAISSTGALLRRHSGAVQARDLWNACRALACPRLENLAENIVSTAGWDDLVLPDLQKQTLRQIASQVRYRVQVYESWGFAAQGGRGLGVSALFTGESGTGKTMAAEVLARELELELFRVDLSAVVSKYIGETEKNLKRVFDAAEEGGVVLLFDEADALFGKRSDVKDSHDRYANIEVSYLLQRMEAYQGLAILTTNLKSSLDRAFQRRIRFTVNFPFPDATQREAIWSRVFPPATPTIGLDRQKLARLNVAGGNIRNIALSAAFLAAEAKTPVGMEHLLQATRQEAQKIERPLSESEIRGWV
jgi:hypothetical protein